MFNLKRYPDKKEAIRKPKRYPPVFPNICPIPLPPPANTGRPIAPRIKKINVERKPYIGPSKIPERITKNS